MRSKNITKNIATGLVLQICTIICGFILPRFIIKAYGSNTNGLVSSITQFLSFISLLDGGIGIIIKAALYKPIARHDHQRIEQILKSSQKFLNHILFIFGFYTIALCVFYPILVHNEASPIETITLIIAIALSSVAEYSLCFIYRIYLDASQKTYIVSIIQTLTIILSTLLAIILIKIGASISIVKLSTAIVYFLRAIIQSLYVKHRYDINLAHEHPVYHLSGRWDGFMQHISTVIHDNADVVILTVFSTPAWISVYAVYTLITTGLKNLIKAFSSGLDSIFGDMLAKQEKQNLTQKLQIYEFIYYTIISIIFSCALALITPFIAVYTHGITDAAYYQPLFGYIIVLAQLFWAIRQPYDAVVFAAGDFKATRNGAIAEALTNVIISVGLVWKFGLVGVAIGTLVAMILRTIIYVVHASKRILERSSRIAISHMLLTFIELTIIFLISQHILADVVFTAYTVWIKCALQIFGISTVIIVSVNCLIYHTDLALVYRLFKRYLKSKNKTNHQS